MATADYFSGQPPDRGQAAWVRYGAAVLFVTIALIVRFAFDKFLGEAHSFPFFLAATAAAAWYGLGPALVAVILGYCAADYFFIAPRHAFGQWNTLTIFSLVTYVVTGLIMSVAVNAGRIATRRARVRAAQLHQERERFRITLFSIGDAVIATDAAGLVTFMNPEAEKLTGWTFHEASGQPLDQCFKIHNEITHKPVDNPVGKVLRDGGTVGLANHTVLVSKSGREIPIDDSAAPIRGPGGEVVGTILVFCDVTDERAAELAARRLAAIVQDSDDAIIGKDLNGIITNWNKAAERIFGYSASEALGQPMTIVIPRERHDEEHDILARLQRGERIDNFETIRRRKDGRDIDVSLTISPIKDPEGRIIGVSKITRDITERKRTDQALRESNARNRAILDSALDAIIVIDHQSTILEFNPAAEKIFGFARADVIGQALAEKIIPERFRARHYQGLATYLATGEGPVLGKRLELPALRANGEEFPAELAILPIPGAHPPTFTGFLRDLTEVKRAEDALQKVREELIKVNRSLESKVQQRTASLQQALQSMETVLYTIAHDLRAPNRAMQGFAQVLAYEYSSRLDDTARSYINRISEAAVKNDSLICDLLEYGRLAHAEAPLRNIDLGQAVGKVLQDLDQQIISKNAVIQSSKNWPSVWANDSILAQILTNLLTNALKFVAPGVAPRVRIWAEESRPNDSSSDASPSPPDVIRLCMQDNGIGIPPDIQSRIFQPFQRGTSDPRYQGTGMGLAIVHKAAERLGGKVGLDSTLGQGSCFWVELLPAHPLESSEGHEQKSPFAH